MDIKKDVVEDKIKLVEKHVSRLKDMRSLSFSQLTGTNFDAAAWNLRGALESTFSICSHILSRIPGVRSTEYAEMALEMGKQETIPMDFAENTLVKMAKYRNRLTHFYFEVTPQEMYEIIQNNLGDFDVFLKHIKKLLE